MGFLIILPLYCLLLVVRIVFYLLLCMFLALRIIGGLLGGGWRTRGRRRRFL